MRNMRPFILTSLLLCLLATEATAAPWPFNHDRSEIPGLVCFDPIGNTVDVVLGSGETTELTAEIGWKGIRKLSRLEVGRAYVFKLKRGTVVDFNRKGIDSNTCALSRLLARKPQRARLTAESCRPLVRRELDVANETESFSWAGAWVLAQPYVNRCLQGCTESLRGEAVSETVGVTDLEP